MRRPFLLAALFLALFSLAAGVIAPADPFEANHLFVVDEGMRVHEYDEAGAEVPTLLTGLAKLTGLMSGRDVAFGPDGGLYVSDLDLDEILVWSSAGGGPEASLSAAGLSDPGALLFNRFGHLLVASEASHSIFVFDCDGNFLREFGGDDGLDTPRGLAVALDGDLFVSNFGSNEIVEYSRHDLGLNIHDTDLDEPWGMAFGRDGRLYVANHGSDDISVFDIVPTGLEFAERIGGGAGLSMPTDLGFGPNGKLYVANGGAETVSMLDTDGNLLDTIGADTGLDGPTGLAFSPKVMGAKISGTLITPDEGGRRRLRSVARLSWAPGSGQLSLLFPDPEDELAEVFGSQVMVFNGLGAGSPNEDRRQVFTGQEPGDTQTEGLSGLGLEFRGKTGDAGAFEPSSFSGFLHRSSPDGAIDAKVKKTSKLP